VLAKGPTKPLHHVTFAGQDPRQLHLQICPVATEPCKPEQIRPDFTHPVHFGFGEVLTGLSLRVECGQIGA